MKRAKFWDPHGSREVNMKGIVINDRDKERLERILDDPAAFHPEDRARLHELSREIGRAEVVPEAEADPDVVAMGSTVRVEDLGSGEEFTYTLVFPSEANIAENRLSVLAPIGTAILGFRAGDVIRWKVPGGVRKLRIVECSPARSRRSRNRTPLPVPARSR